MKKIHGLGLYAGLLSAGAAVISSLGGRRVTKDQPRETYDDHPLYKRLRLREQDGPTVNTTPETKRARRRRLAREAATNHRC